MINHKSKIHAHQMGSPKSKIFSPDLSLIRPGDALIIMPPMAMLKSPSLAAHMLQACAGAAGFQVSIFYANMTLAAIIGIEKYETIGGTQANALLGERLFVAGAYDLPPLGYEPEQMLNATMTLDFALDQVNPRLIELLEPPLPLGLPELTLLEAMARAWVDETAQAVAQCGFKVVGCTTSFEQTAASVALLKRVKQLAPQTVTIIGGANCTGEMAQGIAALSPAIDYVFSGESEVTFPDFLRRVAAGQLPTERIICGQPYLNLDDLPTPCFTEFYEQVAQYLPSLLDKQHALRLPYESSRGCWWGQKHHCIFCGINGQSLTFRQKSPDRVIGELKQLLAGHPARRVDTADSIMPFSFFQTLLPRLKAELPGLDILYDQKSNLSLAQMITLKQAGVNRIVPGIEALSTSLLKRMDKGVSARQNIALLRYGRSVKMRHLHWMLLWGFPGDQLAEYEETLALIPLLRHLEPPIALNFIHFPRFSPYVERPAQYGLRRLRPWGSYAKILPPGVDPAQVAYYFTADYESDACRYPEIILKILEEVKVWQTSWTFTAPLAGQEVLFRSRLEVTRQLDGQFSLRDTRGLPDTQTDTTLTRAQAAAALVARPFSPTAEIDWALERQVGVKLDGWYVPLATAKPELLQEFEKQWAS